MKKSEKNVLKIETFIIQGYKSVSESFKTTINLLSAFYFGVEFLVKFLQRTLIDNEIVIITVSFQKEERKN